MKCSCALLMLAALVLGLAAGVESLCAQPLGLGPEVQIPLKPPYADSMAVGPDGSFGFSSTREARFFTAADAPAGALTTTGKIATRGPAGYVEIVHRRDRPSYFTFGPVIARLLDTAGQPVSPEMVLVEHAQRPIVVGDPAGGFLLSWIETGISRSVRRFDAQGTPVSPVIPVELATTSLALLPGGGLAVAGGDIWDREVFVRHYRPDGSPAGPRIVLAPRSDHGDPRIAADALGRSVALWTSQDPEPSFRSHLRAQRFDASGHPLGASIVVAEVPTKRIFTWFQDLAVRPDGSFLFSWGEQDDLVCSDSCSDLEHHSDVWARGYDAAGNPLGPAFLVSDSTEGDQETGWVMASPDGWIVSWHTLSGPAGNGASSLQARHIFATCGDAAAPALCLQGGRFRAEVAWRVPATGAEGRGTPVPRTGDTGTFWFFAPGNIELIVKVLDGRGINGHFWVFYGSLTDIQFDLTVIDTVTGQRRTWHNPAGTLASRADTEAF